MRRSKKSLGSAILVSVLSASMVLTTPVSVLAQTFNENVTATIDGDVNDGIKAAAKSDVTVKGSVTGNIEVNQGEVSVENNVKGDVKNNGGSIDIKGDLNGRLDNRAGTSKVAGNITTISDSKHGDAAVDVSEGTVTVTGNVSLDSKKGGDAVSILYGVNTDVTINGNITSKSSDTTRTVGKNDDVIKSVYSNGIGIESDGGEINVTVKGNVNVSSNAFATGISVGVTVQPG